MVHIQKPQKGVKEGFIGQRLIVLPPNIKKKLIQNSLIKLFYLTAIGHYPKATHHEIERKTGSNQYILIYCTDGEGDVTILGNTYKLQPNTYIIIPKNISHSYKSNEENPWSIYWIHFTGEIDHQIYKRSLTDDGELMVHSIPFEESRIELFERLYAILEHSFDEKEMEIMAFNLLHFISSIVYYKEANPEIYHTDSISSSIKFMKKNIGEKLEIDTLANEQNLSISHYTRIFKKKTGYSPINYFNQLKIHKSCQYLYFTNRSIKDICVELGFEDPYYFSRLFKKLMGLSPAKYKNKFKI